jgi:uncharacterized protein (TIGR03089 family)
VRELTVPRAGGITAALFGAWAADDPHRPRLVWHGPGRTELSTASLMNWSAKTAGYLVDEVGATPGSPVLWRVRRSWQGLPLLLGCWWAGLVVVDDEAAAADLAGDDVVVAFVDVGDDADADEVVVASPHPFGLAVPDLPALQRNVADAILPQADRFSPRSAGPGADAPAAATGAGRLTVRQVLAGAGRAAATLAEGAVVLSAAVPTLPDGVIDGPLAAWAAGGTYVYAAPPVEQVAADERATATIGVDVPGLPRLGGH